MCGAALGNHPECIQMLCQFGDSPSRAGFIDLSAIVQASAENSVEAVRELLQQRPMLNLSRTLNFAMWHRGATAEMVGQLVDAKADVNEQLRLPLRSMFGMAFFLHGLLYRWGVRRTTGTRIAYHSVGATPLMFAIIRGHFEGAAALLVAKAQVDVPNARKKTALDFAQELGAPQFLMNALEGDLTVCNRMVSSAMANRFLVSHVVWLFFQAFFNVWTPLPQVDYWGTTVKPTVDNCSVVVFEFVEQKFELQIVIEVFFPLLTYSLQLLGLGLLPSARMNPLRRMKKSKQASE